MMSDPRLFDAPGARCEWCDQPIPPGKRRDSLHCSKRCRQASWRFGHREARVTAAGRPMRLAYADPPYPGLSARYYRDHPDYAGEVDHRELIRRLCSDYDAFALSTSSRSLLEVWSMVPDAWLGIWTKPAPPHHTLAPRSAFEPVLFRGQRPRPPDAAHAIDWTHAAPLRDYPGQVVGTKPPEFSWWVFDCLCADPEVDTLDDLYPGSGAVRRAWDRYRPRRAPVPSEGGRIIAGSETGKEQAA